MLEIKNLTKIYRTPDGYIPALRDITFTLNDNEFVFLIGKSGAGKSTLIRLIIREESPTYGDIQFQGLGVAQLPPKFVPAYRRKVGVIFQDYKLLENKTVRENIYFILDILDTPSRQIRQTTDELLELVGLPDRQHLFPRQLSGGERRRVAIARSLASNPQLLIADEPTGDLDPENTDIIMNLLKQINAMGTTIIMTTHNMDIVNNMKLRVLTLDQGELVNDQSESNYALNQNSIEEQTKKFRQELAKRGLDKAIVEKLVAGNIDSLDLLMHLPVKEIRDVCRLSSTEYNELVNALSHETT